MDGHGGILVPHTVVSEFLMKLICSFSHQKNLDCAPKVHLFNSDLSVSQIKGRYGMCLSVQPHACPEPYAVHL